MNKPAPRSIKVVLWVTKVSDGRGWLVLLDFDECDFSFDGDGTHGGLHSRRLR